MICHIVSIERTIFIFIRLHYIPVCFICAAQHKTYMKKQVAKKQNNIHLIFPQPTFTNCLFHQCVVAMNFQPFTHFLVFRILLDEKP